MGPFTWPMSKILRLKTLFKPSAFYRLTVRFVEPKIDFPVTACSVVGRKKKKTKTKVVLRYFVAFLP